MSGPRFVVHAAYGVGGRDDQLSSAGVYDRLNGYAEVALYGDRNASKFGIVGLAERVAAQLNAAYEATL